MRKNKMGEVLDSKEPLVSVVIPIFNVEKYLKKCIESVRAQIYKNIEIILIDDGSEDNSPQICDDYQQLDNRIHVIHKINGGLSDARNAGIDVCTGEYIVFVDSDDYIHPYMIKGMLAIALDEETDIVECGVCHVNENNHADFGIGSIPCRKKILNHDRAIEEVLDYKLGITVWNKLYKSSLFQQIRFPMGRLHEDEFVVPFVIDMCSKYALIDNRYYAYVKRKGSIMDMPFNSNKMDILEAHQSRLEYFSKKYDGKYDMTIKYHFYVACVNLKILMKNQFSKSEVKKIYKDLFQELIVSSSVDINKKIKILLYKLIPNIVLVVKKFK